MQQLDDKRKQKEAGDFFMAGKQAFRNKDVTQAIESFTQAIMLRPEKAEYFYNRGNCYNKIGETQKALLDYSMSIRIDNKTATFYEHRGMCYKKLGNFEESVKDYTNAIRLEGNNGNFYYNRAISYMCLNPPDYEKALEDYNLAVQLSQAKYRPLFNRGNCLRKMGRIAESIVDLKQAVDLESTKPESHNNLALSYLEIGKLEDAVEHFTIAIQLDTGGETAIYYNNRGLANLRLERIEQAFADFDVATQLNPNDPNYFFNRGNAYLTVKNVEQALSDLDEAISLAQSIPAYYHSKGVAFQALGRKAGAIEMFDKALALNPKYVPSLYHLGLMYHAEGQHEQASQMFSAVIRLVPQDRRGHESLGIVHTELKLHQHAVNDFAAAIKFAAQYPDSYIYRGQSYLRLKQYDAAVADLDKAIELGSKDPKTWNLRALAQRCLKNYEEAILDLTEAIAMDPANVDFVFNRSQCYQETGEYDKATQDLHTALDLRNEDDSLLLYHRGLAQYSLSNSGSDRRTCELALRDLRDAVRNYLGTGQQPDCYYHIGLACANMDRHEEAVVALSEAIALSPDMTPYIHERAKSLQVIGRSHEAILDFTRVLRMHSKNAHAYFRRGFAYKALGKFDEAAQDFETAKAIAPDNPLLVVNYFQLHSTDVIELCKAGQEVY